jgi:hypothetical protein
VVGVDVNATGIRQESSSNGGPLVLETGGDGGRHHLDHLAPRGVGSPVALRHGHDGIAGEKGRTTIARAGRRFSFFFLLFL